MPVYVYDQKTFTRSQAQDIIDQLNRAFPDDVHQIVIHTEDSAVHSIGYWAADDDDPHHSAIERAIGCLVNS